MVTKHTTTQWVMETRRLGEAAGMGQEGVANPDEAVEIGSEQNVVPTTTEAPSSTPTAPPADAIGG